MVLGFTVFKSHRWHQKFMSFMIDKRLIPTTKFTVVVLTSCQNLNIQDIQILQKYTDNYLKGHVEDQNVIDFKLQGLIDASQYVLPAFFACCHKLSSKFIKKNLVAFLEFVSTLEEYKNYLAIVVLLSQSNPDAISKDEAAKARELLVAANLVQTPNTYITRVSTIQALLKQLPDGSLFNDSCNSLSTINCQIWPSASALLFEMKHTPGQWLEALKLVTCIRESLSSDNSIPDFSVIEDRCPDWRAWTAWKPNEEKLEFFSQLPQEQAILVHDIIELYGPDFLHSKETCLLKSLETLMNGQEKVFIHGKLNLDIHSWTGTLEELFERALEVFSKAFKISSQAINLFVGAFIKSIYAVDETLPTLESIYDSVDKTSIYMEDFKYLFLNIKTELSFRKIRNILKLLESPSMQSLYRDVSLFIEERLTIGVNYHVNLTKIELREFVDISDSTIACFEEIKYIFKVYPYLLELLNNRTLAEVKALPSGQCLKTLSNIQAQLKASKVKYSRLQDIVDDFICNDTFQISSIYDSTRVQFMKELLHAWPLDKSEDRKLLLFEVCNSLSTKPDVSMMLLHHIAIELSDYQVQKLLECTTDGTVQSCISLSIQLSGISCDQLTCSWSEYLYTFICRHSTTIVQFVASNSKLKDWISWYDCMNRLFLNFDTNFYPAILFLKSQRGWIDKFKAFTTSHLDYLNTTLRPGKALQNILTVPVNHQSGMLKLLQDLCHTRKTDLSEFYNYVFRNFSHDFLRMEKIIYASKHLNEDQRSTCERLADMSVSRTPIAMNGYAISLLHKVNMYRFPGREPLDSLDVSIVASAFHTSNDRTGSGLIYACNDLEKQYDDFLRKIDKIEAMKRALMIQNPQQTSTFLESIGLEDNLSFLAVPDDLVDFVDEIGFAQYEIIFPLDNIKPIQRQAMGFSSARNILLYLNFRHNHEKPMFCVHLDDEDLSNTDHVYWDATATSTTGDEPPELPSCSKRPNITMLQIYRIVRQITLHTPFDIAVTYEQIKNCLPYLASYCPICVKKHDIKGRIYKHTTCTNCQSNPIHQRDLPKISYMFFNFQADIYDLLILSIYNAAKSTKFPQLLPTVPPAFKTAWTGPELINIIKGLPSMRYLADMSEECRSVAIQKLDDKQMNFLGWVSHTPAFIIEATGLLRIPALPNVQQFVVASGSLNIERKREKYKFDTENAQSSSRSTNQNQKSEVLFHGTSIDRLFDILNDGLIVGSGTLLQSTGAVYGSGIYLSPEPSIAFSYAKSGIAWPNSRWFDRGVVLGVEVATSGITKRVDKMFVVQSPAACYVRYIFLVPRGMQAPVARHIVPAMESAFALLRNGIV